MSKPPMFIAVQENGDTFVTFYEGRDRSGRILAFWFRSSGSLFPSDYSRVLGRTFDMNKAGRLVSEYRKSL